MKHPSISHGGYSLIELGVVAAIVAVVATMAVEHYRANVIEGCRGEAKIALENVANAQEKFFYDFNQYASTVSSLPVSPQSEEGIYNLTTGLNGNSNTYVAIAIQDAGQDCLPANDIRYRVFDTGLRQRFEGGAWVTGWN